MLQSLEIHGLRGFATNQILKFVVPNQRPGSGLTVIVGANNAGKSTAVEALRAVAQGAPPSFTQGRRNLSAGDRVTIRVVDDHNRVTVLTSISAGSSETKYVRENGGANLSKLLVLPARRVFSPFFSRSESPRGNYMTNMGFPANRASTLEQFAYRLFTIERHRERFDALLSRVVSPVPNWSIDQMDNGQYFLKVRTGTGTATHSSEGLGEGLISLLYIIDALYDSEEGDVIAVDEPELSLHPALQRKLAELIAEYAATRQIVLSTHSPHFVGLNALPNGASVARVYLVEGSSRISQLSSSTAGALFGLLRNENNPHILGLLAQEIFFAEDNVILLEGQEDVIFFKRIELEVERLNGTVFGWGVGGADNMERIATVLKELGFSKVVGILDGNRAPLAQELSAKLPAYRFYSLPADDVRTKGAAPAKAPVKGLLDDTNDNVRPEYIQAVRALFQRVNQYLRSQ